MGQPALKPAVKSFQLTDPMVPANEDTGIATELFPGMQHRRLLADDSLEVERGRPDEVEHLGTRVVGLKKREKEQERPAAGSTGQRKSCVSEIGYAGGIKIFGQKLDVLFWILEQHSDLIKPDAFPCKLDDFIDNLV